MLSFIAQQSAFYLTLVLLLFLPGYFVLGAVFKKDRFSLFERVVLGSGLSIIIVNFTILILDRANIPLTRYSLVLSILAITAVAYSISKKKGTGNSDFAKLNFTKKQGMLIIILICSTVLIKAYYLRNAVMPGTTDLGHHLYWSKVIATTHHIPEYTQRDVISRDGTNTIGAPKKISDFIIGEQLFYASISLVSGIGFISYFPVLSLFLVNTMSILALFVLALELFRNNPRRKSIAILSLLFIGPLFSIDPPQAKFIAGGVTGNLIANFIVPLTLYFYIRFFHEKTKSLLFFALLFSMGLFYIHHLTGFMFLISFASFIILSSVFNFKEFFTLIKEKSKFLLSPQIIGFFIFALVFVALIYTPSYLTNKAVTTVVGAVSKAGHGGLTLNQFRDTLGETRIVWGIMGIIFVIFLIRKSVEKFSLIMLASWAGVIFLVSMFPDIVKIDLPSGRAANYASYPLSILSSFAMVSLFAKSFGQGNAVLQKTSSRFLLGAFVLLVSFIMINGVSDNVGYLAKDNFYPDKIQETYSASDYLASKMDTRDVLADDHIYITADSFVKLFFMRDYNFPLYRANLERYTNNVDKDEFCTLWMISGPETPDSQKCFRDLGVNFTLVNGKTDAAQFEKLGNFWKVYSNNELNAYYRTN